MSEQTNGTPDDPGAESVPPYATEVQAKIDAFLSAVEAAMTRSDVSPRERQNVTDDLRGQIAEMLAERSPQPPRVEDVEAVLGELDPAESFAVESDRELVGAGVGEQSKQEKPDDAPWMKGGRGCGSCGWGGRRRWWGRWRHRAEIAAAIKHAVLRHGPFGFGLFERFTPRAREAIWLAKAEARRLNHGYIGTEHILAGLVREGTGVAAVVLKKLGLDVEKVRAEMERLVMRGPEPSTAPRLPITPRAMHMLEIARTAAQELGHNFVGTEHLLLGELAEPEGVGAKVLANLGLTPEQIRAETMALMGVASSPDAASVQAAPSHGAPPHGVPSPFIFWPPGTGKMIELGGDEWKFIATGADTGGVYAMFEITIPPGNVSPLLVHSREDKSYYVISGQLRMQLGDRMVDAPAGSFVSIPKGTAHVVKNETAEAAKAIVTATPAGLERFLTEAAAMSNESIDPQQSTTIAKTHGIDVRQ